MAGASFCGLLNMVMFADEIHFHLLRWCVVCVVFLGGIDCNRLCHYHFFKNLIGWITFVHSRGCVAFSGCFLCFGLVGMDFRQKCSIFRCRRKKRVGEFFMGGVGVMKVEFLLNFSIINEKISCVFPSVIGEFFLTLQSTNRGIGTFSH